MYLPGLWNFIFYPFFAHFTDLHVSGFPLLFHASGASALLSRTLPHILLLSHTSGTLSRTLLHFPAASSASPRFPRPHATFPCIPVHIVPHSLLFHLCTLVPRLLSTSIVYSSCNYPPTPQTDYLRQNPVVFPPCISDFLELHAALPHSRHHRTCPWLPELEPDVYPTWAATYRKLHAAQKSAQQFPAAFTGWL